MGKELHESRLLKLPLAMGAFSRNSLPINLHIEVELGTQ